MCMNESCHNSHACMLKAQVVLLTWAACMWKNMATSHRGKGAFALPIINEMCGLHKMNVIMFVLPYICSGVVTCLICTRSCAFVGWSVIFEI